MLYLNRNFAELIGVIIGDGCIVFRPDLGKYYIEIVGDQKKDGEYFDYLSNLVFSIIGKYPDIRPRSNGLRLRFYDKEFVYYLTGKLKMAHGEGKGKRIQIPMALLKSQDLLISCIRGIADSDGSIFLSKKNGCKKLYVTIEISTTSKILSVQITNSLELLGFRAKRRRFHKAGSLPIYRIALNGRNQVEKWKNVIGFSNARKSSKCLKSISF